MAERLSIDVFWSFRSPWSYLATPRLLDWSRRYDLDVVFRPVYPLAIRAPEFFDRQNPQWFSYFMIDVHRVAEFLDLPFKWPNPDPVVQEFRDGRRVTGAVQPYIHRLTRLGIVAAEQGRGMAFADAVSRLIWGGTEHWYDGDHLANATRRAGLDLAKLDAIAVADVDRIEASIARNQADHEAAGHWGVPTVRLGASRFSGRTDSMCCCGGCGRTGYARQNRATDARPSLMRADANEGLTDSQADARLRTEGRNELPQAGRRTIAAIVKSVLFEPMLALLLGAGAIYLALGDLREALILVAFAGLSIVITVVQEARTERARDPRWRAQANRRARGRPRRSDGAR